MIEADPVGRIAAALDGTGPIDANLIAALAEVLDVPKAQASLAVRAALRW